jgi:HSP20 family protein
MSEISTGQPKDRLEEKGAERTRAGVQFTPRVDIYETDKELLLFADLPGVRPDGVDLRFENGELLLHGHVNQERDENVPRRALVLSEYEEGDFYRVFHIHESIDSSKISAELKNGVLTVHLPKVEAARPRQISVQGG